MQKKLQLLKNELVPVYVTDKGEKVVYGTELFECLGSKRQYTDWINERLFECDARKNKDFESFSQKNEKGGRPKTEYIIKLDIAKEMAMLERNEKGKQVRRYFIKIEKKYKESKQSPLTLQQQIQLVAKGTDELYQKVDAVTDEVYSVKKELQDFKETLPLLPEDADRISDAVKKRGVEILGGKKSPAYNDKGLRMRLYINFYSNLKYNFNVRSYKSIKRNQKAQALQIVAEYKPPLFLAEQIDNANAQQTLNFTEKIIS